MEDWMNNSGLTVGLSGLYQDAQVSEDSDQASPDQVQTQYSELFEGIFTTAETRANESRVGSVENADDPQRKRPHFGGYYSYEQGPSADTYRAATVDDAMRRASAMKDSIFSTVRSGDTGNYPVDPQLTGDNTRPTDAMSTKSAPTPVSIESMISPSTVGAPHSLDGQTSYLGQGSPADLAAAAAAAADHKRQRACESCRSLKVRCEPDEKNPQGTCRRCAKAHRECIFTQPTRKRQKRTDSRVAELEKKIDKLTASLHAQRRGEQFEEAGSEESEVEEMQGPAVVPWDPPQQKPHGRRSRDSPDDRNASKGGDSRGSPSSKRARIDSSATLTSNKNITPMSCPASTPVTSASTRTDPSESLLDHPAMTTRDLSMGFGFNLPKAQQKQILLTPDTEHSTSSPPQTSEYLDVVERRLLSMDMATEIFDRFITEMLPHIPLIVFPEGNTAADVRKSKPVLFLAILGVASGTFHPDLNKALNKEVIRTLADRVVVMGEKSIELVQALLVTTVWYYPPEHFEELKFYQLTHMAAVMALDIGISKKGRIGGWRNRLVGPLSQMPTSFEPGNCAGPVSNAWSGRECSLTKDSHSWRKVPFPDPLSVESRRTFMMCYFLCSNVAMALRRPNLLRFTPFMNECIEFLETSPEATKSDRLICQMAKVQHIAEEVGLAWGYDDSSSKINIADSRAQFSLRGFERQLEEWRKNNPGDIDSRWLELSYHTVALYTHEIALHLDHNCEDFRPPYLEENLRGQARSEAPTGGVSGNLLSQVHIDALYTCLSSAHGLMDSLLAYSVEEIRCLPVLVMVRISYAVVVVIKLYFSAAAPKSELGQVIDKDALKLDYYLENILSRLRQTAEDDKHRQAAKFMMIMSMLYNWYQRQRAEYAQSANAATRNGGKHSKGTNRRNHHRAKDAASPASFANREVQTPNSGTGPETPHAGGTYGDNNTMAQPATPLHMLSDVAMGTEETQQPSYMMSNDNANMQQQPVNAMNMNSNIFGQMNDDGMGGVNMIPDFNQMGGLNMNYNDGTFGMDMPLDGNILMDDAFFLDVLEGMPSFFE